MSPEQADPAIDIIIPFYKNAALVAPLFESLSTVVNELIDNHCTVVTVNDSPDDLELAAALSAAVDLLSPAIPCRLLRNERNLGFVRSINSCLKAAVDADHDVILLNSDTRVFPGAITEIRRVAFLDPMTAFVSPRSNNATICSLPHQPEFRNLAPAEAYANFRCLSRHLPDFHYLPTAVGFCLYIKHQILEEFGLFDESYGQGYNEENDLILRANRCGYRAVAANHAFVFHVGEASFSASIASKEEHEKKNGRLLRERYPEYAGGLAKYAESAHYQAEQMLPALLPDSQGRLDLLFDFSSVGAYHNGTFEHAIHILECAVDEWRPFFHVHVMISEEALRFHKLDRLPGVLFIQPESTRVFAIAFRLGQPFEYLQLVRLSRLGVLNVYGMLDPIALDCLYLNQVDLPVIWGTVFAYADGVLYNSDFVREQFRRRFRLRPGLAEMVAYLSLDIRDYASPQDAGNDAGDYILVIGNAFAHKHVEPTVDALNQAFPREKIVAFGLSSNDRQNVLAYTSGNLTAARMRNLLRGARVVVFPSHYEGFGIPVLESLAYSKPILARDIPVLRDIRSKIPAGENLILYESTNDLIRRLKEGFPVWKAVAAGNNGAEPANWQSVTRRIGEFLRGLLEQWSFSGALLPRLEHMQLLAGRMDRPAPSAERPGSAGTIDESLSYVVLADQVRELSQLKSAMRDRDLRIQDLQNSLSWRMTAPVRKMGSLYLRLFKK